MAVMTTGRRCPNAALQGSQFCGLPTHQALSRFSTNQVAVLSPLSDEEVAILANGDADGAEVKTIVEKAESQFDESAGTEEPEADEVEEAAAEADEVEDAGAEADEAEEAGAESEESADEAPESEEQAEVAEDGDDAEGPEQTLEPESDGEGARGESTEPAEEGEPEGAAVAGEEQSD
jgi:transcription termination/antitermination protein NusA